MWGMILVGVWKIVRGMGSWCCQMVCAVCLTCGMTERRFLMSRTVGGMINMI